MNQFFMLLEEMAPGGKKQTLVPFLLMILMFAFLYLVMIRPQKKQQKKEQEMRSNTQVGDEITTYGGIMGRVVTVREDSLIIESGADRNKLRIAKWAIQVNNTAAEKAQAERDAAKAAAEKAKSEKLEKKKEK